MIVAVGKGIGRAHAASQKSAQVRLPLTWAILAHGRQVVTSMVDGWNVMWLGLGLSYFLPCRVSVWAYANARSALRVLSDAKLSYLVSRGSTGRDRE